MEKELLYLMAASTSPLGTVVAFLDESVTTNQNDTRSVTLQSNTLEILFKKKNRVKNTYKVKADFDAADVSPCFTRLLEKEMSSLCKFD